MKVSEILKPKTKKEIMDILIQLSPDEMLVYSSKCGILDGVKIALENGADIDYLEEGNTDSALAYALEGGHIEIVLFLLERNPFISNSCLIKSFDKMDIFKKMIKKVDVKLCYGLKLPMWRAINTHNKEIIDLMREKISQD